MKTSLPAIYPITDVRISGLTHAEQVRRLIEGGATLIQLREKHLPANIFFDDASLAISYAGKHGCRIIINDRVDLALALQADGVHLGQTDLPPENARALIGESMLLGFSTHNMAQLAAAKELPVDYVAIGPIFATGTKTDPDPVVGLEFIPAARRLIGDKPLVAIGGIDKFNVRTVLAAGADSAAVISAVLDPSADIAEQFAALKFVVN